MTESETFACVAGGRASSGRAVHLSGGARSHESGLGSLWEYERFDADLVPTTADRAAYVVNGAYAVHRSCDRPPALYMPSALLPLATTGSGGMPPQPVSGDVEAKAACAVRSSRNVWHSGRSSFLSCCSIQYFHTVVSRGSCYNCQQQRALEEKACATPFPRFLRKSCRSGWVRRRSMFSENRWMMPRVARYNGKLEEWRMHDDAVTRILLAAEQTSGAHRAIVLHAWRLTRAHTGAL